MFDMQCKVTFAHAMTSGLLCFSLVRCNGALILLKQRVIECIEVQLCKRIAKPSSCF